jgi:hypothetical protein
MFDAKFFCVLIGRKIYQCKMTWSNLARMKALLKRKIDLLYYDITLRFDSSMLGYIAAVVVVVVEEKEKKKLR